RNPSRRRAHSASTSSDTSGQSYLGSAAINGASARGIWLQPLVDDGAFDLHTGFPAARPAFPRLKALPPLLLLRLGRTRDRAVPPDIARSCARHERARRLWRAPQDRVHHGLLAPERMFLQHGEIARIGIAAVQRQPLLP